MKNLTFGIATKVFIAIAFIIVLFLGLLLTSFLRTRTLYENVEKLNRIAVPLTLQIGDLQANLRNAQAVLSRSDPFVLKRTVQVTEFVLSFPRRINNNYEKSDKLFQQLSQTEFTAETARHRFNQMGPDINEFNEKFRHLREQITNESETTNEKKFRNMRMELIDLGNRMTRRLERISQKLQRFSDQTLATANRQYRYNIYGFAVLTLLALGLSVLVLYSILRTLQPLNELTRATRRLGEGEYPSVEQNPTSWFGTDEVEILANEFNRMVEQLEKRDKQIKQQHREILKSQKLATIGEMTSLITHEIRNPLSSINLNTDMLDDEIDPAQNEEASELLTAIRAEIERLSNITEEYLDYARLPTPTKEKATLSEVIKDVVDFNREEWERKGIDLTFTRHDSSEAKINIDEDQIRRAFLNIAQNAVEALEECDEPRELKVSVSEKGTHQTVVVEDTGPGISDEIEGELFTAFETDKSTGSGLGLTMAQQIIDDHQGDIQVQSGDWGTRFTIKLPLTSRL